MPIFGEERLARNDLHCLKGLCDLSRELRLNRGLSAYYPKKGSE
jgi:hypothetical protein